ncbi:MAG TPA: hypothetical protein VE783_04255 [Candidatus Limnocylindrales bacterium]|nr:hypothetical protein [Candidatus Limnocylindrales bacterium]
MKIRRIPLIPLVTLLLGCGSMMNNPTTRQLTAITVSPASAVVQNGTSKQVQFTAMGTYNMAPMTATPQVVWSIAQDTGMMGPGMMGMMAASTTPAGVTISASGMAQCTTFTGTVMVSATSPMDPTMPMGQMGAMTMNVTGSAQLTCP